MVCAFVSLKLSAQSNSLDSASTLKKDTLTPNHTEGMDSLKFTNEKGDIETTIFYHAEDSIMMDVPNKKAYLYGKAQINYQDMQLDAEQIEIEWAKNIIAARGKVDSSGRYKGNPIWKQGAENYETDSMRYNMQTKKGIIHGIVTKQGEGYLHGDTAKRTDDAIFLKNGIYTTCNLKHPHFYISARKLKVIPDDKAICGPFNIVLEDIPTPIGFWMGFFPITDKKSSGIIIPTFGENQSRGMYLSNGGYYWSVNDYLGIQVVGDVYANGSWLLRPTSTYLSRYKYRGSLNFGLSKVKDGFDNATPTHTDFSVTWAHSTIAKRNGNLTANVDLKSSKFTKTNDATANRTNNNTSSSITYNKVFGRSPFSTNISLRESQNNYQSTANNSSSAIYNVTLPAASLTMNRINPLKRKIGDGNKWYEKIFINYQGNFNYNFDNVHAFYDSTSKSMKDSTLKINEANLNNYILPDGLWASNHVASIGSTFKLFKYFNLNPSATYSENWHQKKLIYIRAGDITKVTDTLNSFYRTYYMTTAIEVNTRFYGRLNFGKNNLIQGIRHTVNPSVRMTYSPDFTNTPGGGFVELPGDTDKVGKPIKRFQHLSNQTPLKQELLHFTVSNMLEMKLKNKKDTTGENPTKKTNLLDNLSLDGGYNFGADSLKMENVTLNARTKLLNKFDINLTSVFDPYSYLADSSKYIGNETVFYNPRKINTYLLDSKGKLAQLSIMNLTIGTRFSGKQKPAKKDPLFDNAQMKADLDYIRANPAMYIDFNVPWSIVLSYTYNYTHTGLYDPVINQALAASGDFSLTPKWKIIYSTGYNFKEHAITYSNFTVSRDLHCWQMNITVSPFGSLRTFNFMIAAKSQLLQTLKLNKRSPTFIQ